MTKYYVLIEETLAREICIEAENQEQADEIAGKVYDNNDIELGADDISDTTIGGEYTREAPDTEPAQFTPDYLK